ncbi:MULTISPECIES: sensor histidine kinase [Phenylobacterium]|uniref:histidine kinase n=1 Tax=Phenylobacterium koreense TaxID=266125 RepID=A0ABV2EDM6_9CAUL
MAEAGLALARGSAARLLDQAFHSWEGLVSHLPVGIYICDRHGGMVFCNRRASELWEEEPVFGRPPAALAHAYHADGAPMTLRQSPVSEALATGVPVRDREVVLVRPGGRRTHVLFSVEPIFDERGMLIGAVNCVQDVTDLRQARDMLRARQGWSRRVVEAAPIALCQTDADGVLLGFNPAAVELWGREPRIGKDRWCGAYKLYEPDGAPMPLDRSPIAMALKERRQISAAEVIFERPDGGKGAFLAYSTPLFSPGGELAGAINIMIDITERKRAEDLQKTLLDELNHRVKNTLATVQSLAAHSFHDVGDPAGMRQAFEARLMALSGAHNRLAEQRWEAADLGDLVAGVLAPYGDEAILCEGPQARLSTRASVTFAMVLHELATNAATYGALSEPQGRLLVHWSRQAGSILLEWRESRGPPVREPDHSGFGLRFIRRAVERELAGDVSFDFAPIGFKCRISAPIPATV